MKVAFVTDNDIYSGIGRQNYTLFNELKKKGVDIDLINLSIPKRYKGVPKGKCITSNFLNNYYLSLFAGVLYVFPLKLSKLLKDGGYTHVILGNQFLGYLYNSLSKNQINRIIIVHDLCLLYKRKKSIGDIIYNKILMYNLDKFENLIFISNFTKNDYIKYYNNLTYKRYKTIYQGIDKQNINESLKKNLIQNYNFINKIICINVGSEDSRKNIITYLKIAEHYKNNKNLIFIRVGKKSKESEVYIKLHKINNVLYVSGLSDEELIALYSLSNILISTSLYEGYGRQIFEGYFYCNNIITSKVSDVAEIFKGDKSVTIINDPFDIDSYIHSVENVLKNGTMKKISKIQGCEGEADNYIKYLKMLNS